MQEKKLRELNFYSRLHPLMKQKNMNQKALAKAVGVTEGTITGWKNGSHPKAEVMSKLELLFNVSSQFLLTGKKPSGKRYVDRLTEDWKESALNEQAERLEKVIDYVQSELSDIRKSIVKIGKTRAIE